MIYLSIILQAYRKLDDMATKQTETLRKLTKQVSGLSTMKVEEEDIKSIIMFALLRNRKELWFISLYLSESNLKFLKLLSKHITSCFSGFYFKLRK